MTAPRPQLRNITYQITRRVTERKFLLLPDRAVRRACGYVLAESQRRFGVLIHAFNFQGNHYHCLFTDVRRNAPAFYHFLHTNLARALNNYRRRKENFWAAPAQTHQAVKLTAEENLASILYIVLNPVKAGLVHAAHLWEGLVSHTQCFDDDRETTFERPGFFFDPLSWPDTATLTLSKPPGWEHLTEKQFHDMVRQQVAKEEKAIRARMKEEGRKFVGLKRIRETDPNDQATSRPKPKPRKPKGPSHQKNWRDWLKRWRQAYREARERLLQGAKAVFPIGTYALERYFGVKVGQGPKPPPRTLNP